MDSKRTLLRLADVYGTVEAPPQAAVVETIDFLADERKRTHASPPPPPRPPEHRDILMAAAFQALIGIAPPSASALRCQRDNEELVAMNADVWHAYEDNKRLRSALRQVCDYYEAAPRRRSRPSTSSNPHDGLVAQRPLLPDHRRRPPNDGDAESSNTAAARAGDSGSPRTRKRKEVMIAYEPAEGRHHDGRNSNKSPRSPSPPPENDEKAAALRKPRVIVRFRTGTDDIKEAVKIDGCQWRKYGQKIPKGSPRTPRCYYKCSMANQCPMRKHLQRCADEESIVNATYEGAHNHPLPQTAIPMALAAAAALEMIISRSMPFGAAPMDVSVLAATMPPSARAPRAATVSTSAPFPTAVLDLTGNCNDPALFPGKPEAAQFQAAVPGGAAPGRSPQPAQVFGQALRLQTAVALPMLQMPPENFAAAFAAFLDDGRDAGGGNGGAC